MGRDNDGLRSALGIFLFGNAGGKQQNSRVLKAIVDN